MVAVSCLGQVGIDSLTVVYAHHIGWGSGVGIGLLYVVMPVAAIVTGFFLPSAGDPMRLARLVVGCNVALCTLSVVAFLVLGSTPVGIVGIAAQGVLDMMVTPLFLVAEARVPATHRGTVFAFFSTCFMAMQLLGALVAGALTELVGIEAAFALACAADRAGRAGTAGGCCGPRRLAVRPQPAEALAAAAADRLPPSPRRAFLTRPSGRGARSRRRPDRSRDSGVRSPVTRSRIAASRARRLSRRTTASRTSMPPAGLASACRSSASESTFQCGVRVAAHRLARSTWCGVPNSRS